MRQCAECKVEIPKGMKSTAKYCSAKCRTNSAMRRYREAHKGATGLGSEAGCKFCGERFVKRHSRQVHCSKECKNAYKYRKQVRVHINCIVCGTKLVKNQYRYCSEKCRHHRVCQHCDKVFYSEPLAAKYCGLACKYAAARGSLKNEYAAEYTAWRSLRHRCRSTKPEIAKNYRDRGIDYDPRWVDFETFLNDVKPRPSDKHSLDRKNNNKGYWPDNVRWTLMDVQNANKRGHGHEPVTNEMIQVIKTLHDSGTKVSVISRTLNLSRPTVYKALEGRHLASS